MSTRFTPSGGTRTNAADAGELTLSLREVVERLGSRLPAQTLDELVREIVLSRRTEVRPGELITAELMNQILFRLTSLEARVAALEARGGTTPAPGPLTITELIPANSVRLDSPLEVRGRNFGFSTGALRITLDNVAQNEVTSGSDERVVFVVRNIRDVTATGKPVILLLNNGTSADERRILVTGAQDVGGTAEINIGEPDPRTIQSLQPVTFRCTLTSQATLRTTFNVAARATSTVSPEQWQQAQISVLNSDGRPITATTFELDPRQSVNFIVRIESVPRVATGTAFTLNVTATSGRVTGSSSREFMVGQPTVPEDTENIPVFSFASASPSTIINQTRDTITLRSGQEGAIVLRAEFAAVATYDVTLLFDPDPRGWVAALTEPAPAPGASRLSGTYDIRSLDQNGRAVRNPEFALGPGTATTGTILIVRIRRSGLTSSRTMRFNLVRG